MHKITFQNNYIVSDAFFVSFKSLFISFISKYFHVSVVGQSQITEHVMQS